jgi:hypothetical protein
MRSASMLTVLAVVATALVFAPTNSRADGSGGAAVLLPIVLLGSAEFGLLAGGTTVALGSRATAKRERPNRAWYRWSYGLGATNLVIGGVASGAFVDACIKVVRHDPNYLGGSVWQNGLNAYALAFGIAHLSVAALDLGFAISGSLQQGASRATFVPIVARDSSNHTFVGLGLELKRF